MFSWPKPAKFIKARIKKLHKQVIPDLDEFETPFFGRSSIQKYSLISKDWGYKGWQCLTNVSESYFILDNWVGK